MDYEDDDLTLQYEKYAKNKHSIKSLRINSRYEVKKQLGSGSYGKVFKAVDLQKNRWVAMKLIDIKRINDEVRDEKKKNLLQKLIKSEGNIMKMCRHRHLVECYQIYENANLKILSIEYCNRGSLRDLLTKTKVLFEDEAISILKQIVHGLSELHRHNIIHRDLKPENIFCHNGCYKIGDFGFAKVIPQFIQYHSLLGTMQYAAPEIRQNQPYNFKADIYSLGVIYYEMICADYPLEKRARKAYTDHKKFKTKGHGNPSKESLDFLSKCLVPQQDRMDWKNLKDHPIFRERESAELPNNYEISVLSISEIDLNSLIESQSVTITQNIEKSNSYFGEENVSTQSLTMEEIVQVQNIYIVDKEQKIYNQLIKANLNCLKANYIYLYYLVPLKQWNALDMGKRSTIELMYLLSQRCFLYVSRIQQISKKLDLKETVEELKQFEKRTSMIYDVVKKVFNQYSELLEKAESKFFQVLKDKFKNVEQKNIIMSGIENFDYDIDEHVKYTQKQYLDKMRDAVKCSEKEVTKNLRDNFQCYSLINAITEEQTLHNKFAKIVDKILDKNSK